MNDEGPEPRRDSPREIVPRESGHALKHGRSLRLAASASDDVIEVTSPEGQVELSIVLTRQGPVLKLSGARLQIDSSDTVAIHCNKLELKTRQGFDLESGGDIGMRTAGHCRVKSRRQTFIDGDWVNLNCLDRTGYHDDPARLDEKALSKGSGDVPQQLPEAAAAGESAEEPSD